MSGRDELRALGVTTAQRADVLPDVPSIAEFVPGYEAGGWYGIGVPRNVPAEIVDKLNREINANLADPKLKTRLADIGYVTIRGLTRRVWQHDRAGNRKMGQGDKVCRHKA